MGLFHAKCKSTARLDGKTAIITGANTGIGKFTAQDFYRRGARVIIACRDVEKSKVAINDIKEACRNEQNLGSIEYTKLDLSDLQSIKSCTESLLANEARIDLLVNNAGVMMCPQPKTKDGFEMQIGTNHLGPFLFTLLLLPKICQSTPARIVNVSSMAHKGKKIDLDDLNWEKKTYDPLGSYQQSKLANILFTKELARRLKENNITGVTTYALHPGVIKTDITRHLQETAPKLGWFYINIVSNTKFVKSPEQGAQTTIYCAVDEACANQSGLYYSDCAEKSPVDVALSEEDAKKLWEISWKLVKLPHSYNPFVQNLN